MTSYDSGSTCHTPNRNDALLYLKNLKSYLVLMLWLLLMERQSNENENFSVAKKTNEKKNIAAANSE